MSTTHQCLSCPGGHAEVVHLLVNAGADVDSQDNRKVSCLMAAFRKGHVKVVKWLVKHVMQFPSDQECVRYIATVTDKVNNTYVSMTLGTSLQHGVLFLRRCTVPVYM